MALHPFPRTRPQAVRPAGSVPPPSPFTSPRPRLRRARRRRLRVGALVVAASVVWAASPASASISWSSGVYAAYGDNPILCFWSRSGIEKVGKDVDFWGQTLLMRELFCSKYDLHVTERAAIVETILWSWDKKTKSNICAWYVPHHNAAGSPSVAWGAKAPAGLLAKCQAYPYLVAKSNHWAWRHGAWRFINSQSPSISYP